MHDGRSAREMIHNGRDITDRDPLVPNAIRINDQVRAIETRPEAPRCIHRNGRPESTG
jgi:hypothetical protein